MEKTLVLREEHWHLLGCIQRFIKANGYSPSVRELMALTGARSTSRVHFLLKELEDESLIRQTRGTARSIVLARLPKNEAEGYPEGDGYTEGDKPLPYGNITRTAGDEHPEGGKPLPYGKIIRTAGDEHPEGDKPLPYGSKMNLANS